MNIVQTIKFTLLTPWHQSVLLQANHGLGKSSIVNLAGQIVGAGFMDLRLSQNDVGDIKGLPFMLGGRTHFAPPSWFPIRKEDEQELQDMLTDAGMKFSAKERPEKFFLFLDEMNRGTREVTQTAFQLVLDYEMNGFKLPEYCKVVAAVNANGNLYHVLDWDPALLDRFAVVDFNPKPQEWLDWAKGSESKLPDGLTLPEWYSRHREALEAYDAKILQDKAKKAKALLAYQQGDTSKEVMAAMTQTEARIHPAVYTFITKRPEALNVTESILSNNENRNKRLYSARSWEMLSSAILRAEATDPNWLSNEDRSFRTMFLCAFLGTRMGSEFDNFLTNDYVCLSADVILNKWDKTVEEHLRKKAKTIEKGSYNRLIIEYLKDDKNIIKNRCLPVKKAENLYQYLKTSEKEVVSDFWKLFTDELTSVAPNWYDSKKEYGDIILEAIASPEAIKNQKSR